MAKQPPKKQVSDLPVGSMTKCVYFPNKSVVDRTQKVLTRYSRVSLSSLLNQMLTSVIDDLEAMSPSERKVETTITLWL